MDEDEDSHPEVENDEEFERAVIEMGDEEDIVCEQCDDQEEVEVKPPKFLRRPGQPSKKEKDEHDTLHVNYRSWCRYCVMGKADDRRHANRQFEDHPSHIV